MSEHEQYKRSMKQSLLNVLGDCSGWLCNESADRYISKAADMAKKRGIVSFDPNTPGHREKLQATVDDLTVYVKELMNGPACSDRYCMACRSRVAMDVTGAAKLARSVPFGTGDGLRWLMGTIEKVMAKDGHANGDKAQAAYRALGMVFSKSVVADVLMDELKEAHRVNDELRLTLDAVADEHMAGKHVGAKNN